MMLNSQIVACVLAGGKSSRMGIDKAFLPFGGKNLLQHTVEVLQACFKTVIISSSNPMHQIGELLRIEDIYVNCGPLGGIHAVMRKFPAEKYFFTSCDTPMVSPKFLKRLISFSGGESALIPEYNGKTEPLCGIYNHNIADLIENNLKENKFALNQLISSVNGKFFRMDAVEKKAFEYNINSKDNYNKLLHDFS